MNRSNSHVESLSITLQELARAEVLLSTISPLLNSLSTAFCHSVSFSPYWQLSFFLLKLHALFPRDVLVTQPTRQHLILKNLVQANHDVKHPKVFWLQIKYKLKWRQTKVSVGNRSERKQKRIAIVLPNLSLW